MDLSLIRDMRTDRYCQGILRAAALEFQTLELPWVDAPPGKGGHPDRSCVPAGVYQLALHNSPKHPRSLALVNPDLDVFHNEQDVPVDRRPYARTEVLLHVANRPDQLLGCIGLGLHRGTGCIFESLDALALFDANVPWIEGHLLSISYAQGVIP